MAIAPGETIEADDILGLVSFQTYAGNTLSLATVAGEKVMVIAKGRDGGATHDVSLTYNGVVKDTASAGTSGGSTTSFCLLWMDTPGATTHDIHVDGSDVVIMVIRIKQA